MNSTVKIVDTPGAMTHNPAYIFNKSPLAPNPMTKLPLGAIKPKGWIKKQIDLMTEGMTGRLTELSAFLKPENGWLGGDDDGWEEQPYWFRGFYNLGVISKNDRVLKETKKWIEAVIATQNPDGYYGPKNQKLVKANHDQELPDIWGQMVMNDALISHYEATGDERVITLLTKFFEWCRDLPDNLFLPEYDASFGDWRPIIQKARAAEILPHIYWLYNRTGDEWLIPLGERFYKKNAPPQGEWLDVHVVNFTQRFRYPGNFYVQSNNPKDLEESENWYKQHLGIWGQMPGGVFAADENIRDGKTDPKQGFETCAMVEFNKSFYILGQITGKAFYADRCENMFFNSFPPASTPDIKALHYLTACNQPQLDKSTNHDYQNKGRQIDYSPHIYRCCQHNVAMGWPWFIEHLWMATVDGGLVKWIYGSSEVTAKVANGKEVTIIEETEYPFRENVKLTVKTNETVQFPLYLRVPNWCDNYQVSVNGKAVDVKAVAGKYILIDQEWSNGDVIEIIMPATITITEWEKNANSVTVNRGPLSYSLKIGEDWRKFGENEEWPDWEVFPTSPWNYGLIIDRQNPAGSLEVTVKNSIEEQPWTVNSAPIEIKAKGKRIPNWTLVDETITSLQPSPIKSEEPVEEITLVPMGCARLRISSFPTIGEGGDAKEWVKVDTHEPTKSLGLYLGASEEEQP